MDPNAEQAALRDKERELSELMTEKDRLLGIFESGESLVATFFQLEADGEMNLDDQNAMKEAIADCMKKFSAWMKNFAAGHATTVEDLPAYEPMRCSRQQAAAILKE